MKTATTTHVDVSELEDLIKQLENLAGVALDKQFSHDVFILGKEIQKAARKLAPFDTNAMRLSIESSISKEIGGIAVEVGPTQPYGKYVEYGTRPHPVPVAAIAGWAKRKGLNPYAVAKSIAKKGTKAHPFMAPALQESDPLITRITEEALEHAIKVSLKV